jgi:hypothetical protein
MALVWLKLADYARASQETEIPPVELITQR